MSYIKQVCFLLWCLAATHAYAGSQDTTYIVKFKRNHNIQFNSWLTDIDLLVLPRKQERDLSVQLKPNVKGQAGIAVGFKYITLAFGVQIPGTESNEKQNGKTKYYDFSFGYFKRKFGGEIYYRNFKGMLREGNDVAGPMIRPDIYLATGGVNIFYAANHTRFSMRSAFSQQELQKKSAGSFVLLGNVQFRYLLADSSIITPNIDQANTFYEINGLSEMRFITVNMRPGYAHNFVSKGGRWFISPAVFTGIGTGWYNTQSNAGYNAGVPLDWTFHAKTFAGINSPLWFCTLYYAYDGSLNVFKNSVINLNTHSFGVNVGYRLNNFGVKWL
jgi:hypothetical protein